MRCRGLLPGAQGGLTFPRRRRAAHPGKPSHQADDEQGHESHGASRAAAAPLLLLCTLAAAFHLPSPLLQHLVVAKVLRASWHHHPRHPPRKAPRKGCPHTSQPLSCFSSIHRWMQPRCAHCRQAAVGMWEAGAAGRSLIPYGGQLRRGLVLTAQDIKRLHADSCTCMLPLQLQIPLSRVSSPSS